MKKFEAKKQIRNRIYSKTTIFILLFFTILLARGVFTIYLRNEESKAMKSEAEAKLRELTKRKEVINKEIEKLSSAEGVEEEIRQKFNVAKPGEKVVIIVPSVEATTTPEERGFISNLWHKIWK